MVVQLVNIEDSKKDCENIKKMVDFIFDLRYPKSEDSKQKNKHIVVDRLCEDFKSYCIRFHFEGVGNVFQMLAMLMDDDNLSEISILNENFICGDVSDLLKGELKNHPIFLKLIPVIIESKGKGVGEGELLLPFIFKDYQFSNESDGEFILNGQKFKVEVKKSGASLKVIETGVTKKGHVDELNKEYFKGTCPGYLDKFTTDKSTKESRNLFQEHLDSIKDPNDYREYFEELYPTACPDLREKMIKNVIENYEDPIKVTQILGQFALESYQKLEGWNNIITFKKTKNGYKIGNIKETRSEEILNNYKFQPKCKRGKDSQAIADGYVNISFA